MNKKDAYKMLLDGKKITKERWNDGYYIYMNEVGNIYNKNGSNIYLNDYDDKGWVEYVEDNRKEVPRQMDYLKELYRILYRKNGDIRVPCYGLNCDKCPLKVYDGDCLQIKMRTELEKVNKEWKLDK